MTLKQYRNQLNEYHLQKQKIEKQLAVLKLNLRNSENKIYDLENNLLLKFIFNESKLEKEKQEMKSIENQINVCKEELEIINGNIRYTNNKIIEIKNNKKQILNNHPKYIELKEKLDHLLLKQKETKESLEKYRKGVALCKDAKEYVFIASHHIQMDMDPRSGFMNTIWKNDALNEAQDSLNLVKEFMDEVNIKLDNHELEIVYEKYEKSLEIILSKGFDSQTQMSLLNVRRDIEKIIEISKSRIIDLENKLLNFTKEEKILREEMNNL